MAYTYDFKDNVVYGAEDINAVRASILTKGVVEESVTSCKVVQQENGVKILQGQAVFADGCRIAVDDEGVVVTPVFGVTNYVYLLNNTLAGVCEVLTDTGYPSGDFVLLAEIDAEGNILDRREFAQLKTADAERYAASFTAELTIDDSLDAGSVIGTVTLPKSGCSYIEFSLKISNDAYGLVRLFPKENCFVSWSPLEGNPESGYVVETYAYSKKRHFKFEVNGNQMNVILNYISKKGTETYKMRIAGVCMR